MKMENLAMPSFNTTLMGVLKGASECYQMPISDPTLFGASGHAFLINIHEQLCPSGPYVWRRDRAAPLLRNLGLQMIDLGFYSPKNGEGERAAVEQKLRDALDKGIPCSLINLENQLITGYDANGLFTAQPWAPKVDFPPARLTFGSWQEFGEKFHVNFYIIRQHAQADPKTAVLDSLDYAVDLHQNPSKHSVARYGAGPEAYSTWIKAAPEHGSGHGNWWNATVWSECRKMASLYMREIGEKYPRVAEQATELSKAYSDIGDALGQLSDKQMEVGAKISLLKQTKEKDAAAIEKVSALAASLRAKRGE